MSPTCGSRKWKRTRSTSTRWPTSRVGSIDWLGIRNGFTRNAWIRSARPSAIATIVTSSTSEFFVDSLAGADWPSATCLLRVRVGVGGRRLGIRSSLRIRRLRRIGGGGLGRIRLIGNSLGTDRLGGYLFAGQNLSRLLLRQCCLLSGQLGGGGRIEAAFADARRAT